MRTQIIATCCVLLLAHSAAGEDKLPGQTNVSATAWGRPRGDLQSGLRCDAKTGILKPGDSAQLALLVRNVGDKTVEVKRYSSPPLLTSERKGRVVTVFFWPGPMDELMVETKSLKPNESVVVATAVLLCEAQAGEKADGVRLPPGRYHIGCDRASEMLFTWSDDKEAGALPTGYLDIELSSETKE